MWFCVPALDYGKWCDYQSWWTGSIWTGWFYETINKSTLGIFQLEGAGASEYTYRMKPSNFDEVAADLALVRPGAQDSGDADLYLNVKEGRVMAHYDHPLLEPILRSTMGAIVYQEQAMQIAKVLAGFTDSEADILRKGIGKKLDGSKRCFQLMGCIGNEPMTFLLRCLQTFRQIIEFITEEGQLIVARQIDLMGIVALLNNAHGMGDFAQAAGETDGINNGEQQYHDLQDHGDGKNVVFQGADQLSLLRIIFHDI